MYTLRAALHARPAGINVCEPAFLAGDAYSILRLDALQTTLPMAVSFEQAREQLEKLPRMFTEPDGAFVWVAPRGDPRWQLDGCLYDRDDRVVFVDVVGSCTEERFNQLLAVFGWPASRLMFRIPQHAVFLEEPEFRRYVQARG